MCATVGFKSHAPRVCWRNWVLWLVHKIIFFLTLEIVVFVQTNTSDSKPTLQA